jgi:hypothetical protein
MKNKKFIKVLEFIGFIVLKNSTNSKNTITSINALCFLLFALCSLLFAAELEAKVTGACSNCHTMHNSQGGQAMAQDYSSGGLVEDPTPNAALLISSCVGCHFNSGTTTITADNTPIVLNAQDPGASALAGGNFYYSATGLGATNNKGHNVKNISAQESSPMDVPPGFKASVTLPNSGTGPASWSLQLTCAGTYGCHGDRGIADEVKSIFGAHHQNINIDSSSTADKVYNSYRFLYGIKGAEDSDWEKTVSSTDHNGYQGNSAYGSLNTISYLCGECHGNYHANANLGGTGAVGDSTPWRRHPSDFAFSGVRDNNYTGSEYALYTTYDVIAPVAESSPSTTNSVVNSGSIVMCLSCHRAHASAHFKMMRWDYKGWPGNFEDNYCAMCHTSKQ